MRRAIFSAPPSDNFHQIKLRRAVSTIAGLSPRFPARRRLFRNHPGGMSARRGLRLDGRHAGRRRSCGGGSSHGAGDRANGFPITPTSYEVTSTGLIRVTLRNISGQPVAQDQRWPTVVMLAFGLGALCMAHGVPYH